jgi:hypothetical protein
MIDALQWIVTIGRFNINTAVITMSESNCTYRYLLIMKHASIRARTEEPDFCDLSDKVHDFTYFVYIKVERSYYQ